ncbi:MAG: hypothetical protein U9Q39_00730, partial [Pseudomonadota bacterium]|nr:hypothetical protein [Pseudomonadota bacterium]
MYIYERKFFLKRVLSPAFSRWLLAALFLLLSVGVVQATEIEPENLVQRCRTELMPAIEKGLPGIEELWFEDLSEVDKWLAGSDDGAGFSVLQVGCWNRKNGIVPVQLELYSDSGKESRRWFRIKVSGKERVLLAKRDLVRGEPVQSSDFSSRLVDCQSL